MADPSDDIDDIDTGDIDASTMPTAQYPVSPLAYGQRWTRDPTMVRGALDLMARSYKTSTDAIRDAKAALMAKRTGNGEAWLAFGAGLLKPTRTGSFGESLGQAGEAMLGPLQRARAEELQRQNMLTGYDLKSATLDRQMASDMLRASRTPVGATGPMLLPVGGGGTGGGGGPAPAYSGSLPEALDADTRVPGIDARYHAWVGSKESGQRMVPNQYVDPITGETKSSGAFGTYQFMPATWQAVVASPLGKKYGLTLDGIKDPQQQEIGERIFTKMNYDALKGELGRDPTPVELRAAHALGAGGASKLIKASPMRMGASLYDPSYGRQNPYLNQPVGKIMGDWQAQWDQQQGATTPVRSTVAGVRDTQAGGEAPRPGRPPPQGSTIADANDIMPGLKLPKGSSIAINPKTLLPYTDRNGNIATVNGQGRLTYVQAPKKGSGQDRIKVFDPETNQYVWYRQSTGEKLLDRNGNVMLAGPAPADTTVPGGSMQAMMPNGKVGIWVPRANNGKGDWQRDAQGNPLEAPRDPNAANMAARQRRAHAQTAAILAAEQKDNRYGPNEAAARYQQLFDHFMSQEDTTGQDRPGPVPPASGGAGPTTPAAPPAAGGTIPRAPSAPAPATGGAIPPPAIAPTPKPSIDEQAEARANAPINAKYIDDARRAADTAGTQLAQINVVRSLNDKDITGAMAPMQEFMGRWAEALGLETIGGKKVRDFIRSASDQKSFFALSNAFLLAVQEAQKGVSTEGDAARISDSWAKLSNTKDTNRFLLNYYENMAWWQKNRANFLNGVISRGGTNKAAIKEWEEFKRKTPLTAMTGENKDQLMFLPEYIKRAQAALPNMDKNEVAAAAIKKWQREYGG